MIVLPPEPSELWAFRAGRKPVAFLTVAPADEAQALAGFLAGGPVHVERRERRVLVGAQDRWTDRRDVGEPRVELYVSRDASLAREAAALQAEGDPSGSLVALGRLMGYPDCCVAAFAAQPDRSNNSRNRYASAAGTVAAERWPWALANLHAVLAPFYPCRYDCPVALDWVEAALGAMEAAHPGTREALAAYQGRPVLYFDHDHQAILDGEAVAEGDPSGRWPRLRARYVRVAVPERTGAPFAEFAGALALGDELVFDDRALQVLRAGAPLFTLARTDPALGLLAPFSR
jgi:hypothetical protein